MSRKILDIATFGLAGAIFGGKGKKKAEAPAPAPEAPAIMPTPDDAAIRAARRRSIIRQLGRRGRSSTMLSDPGSRLGG